MSTLWPLSPRMLGNAAATAATSSSSSSSIEISSSGFIAWMCLLLALFVPLVVCLAYCWYHKFQSHRRAVQTLERERQLEDLSRIEANIKSFSAVEKTRQTRRIQSAMKDQMKKLTTADIEKQQQQEEDSDDNTNNKSSCGICLEDFAAGDFVAQSANATCKHIFHEPCIVSWYLARQNAYCPFCRIPFVCIAATNTSIASHDLISSHANDLECHGRVEQSTASSLDEAEVTDALEVLDEVAGETDVESQDETDPDEDVE